MDQMAQMMGDGGGGDEPALIAALRRILGGQPPGWNQDFRLQNIPLHNGVMPNAPPETKPKMGLIPLFQDRSIPVRQAPLGSADWDWKAILEETERRRNQY